MRRQELLPLDAEGNLVREEVFPQCGGRLSAARLFHPHAQELKRLIEACVEQAWAKLAAEASAEELALGRDGAGGRDGSVPVVGDRAADERT
jgi:hypothetical protein